MRRSMRMVLALALALVGGVSAVGCGDSKALPGVDGGAGSGAKAGAGGAGGKAGAAGGRPGRPAQPAQRGRLAQPCSGVGGRRGIRRCRRRCCCWGAPAPAALSRPIPLHPVSLSHRVRILSPHMTRAVTSLEDPNAVRFQWPHGGRHRRYGGAGGEMARALAACDANVVLLGRKVAQAQALGPRRRQGATPARWPPTWWIAPPVVEAAAWSKRSTAAWNAGQRRRWQRPAGDQHPREPVLRHSGRVVPAGADAESDRTVDPTQVFGR